MHPVNSSNATSVQGPASPPLSREPNPTSSSSTSSSSRQTSGSLDGISVAHDSSSSEIPRPSTSLTPWNHPSSSSDLCSIVKASSAKRPRNDKPCETQPSTIATPSASSSQSTLNTLEELCTNIENSLRRARAEGADRDIISGYVESLERLHQAIQARNDGHTPLSSYYQGSAIALFKKSEAKAQAKAKDDQGRVQNEKAAAFEQVALQNEEAAAFEQVALHKEKAAAYFQQVPFHDEEAAAFEQVRMLFDQAATVYEQGHYQAAEEWGHKAQFFAKLSKIRGYGIFETNDFGEQSITALKMIEMIRNNIITPEFLEEYRVPLEETEGALSNEISKDIKTLEEKIKLVQILSEHSFETRHCLEKLKGQLVEVEERERRNFKINSDLSTQKDQIQNRITALEALLLTPMNKEKFVDFFKNHKLSEHSFETTCYLEKLKGQLVEVEERERENLTIDSDLSTQKDQIQSTITALEAIFEKLKGQLVEVEERERENLTIDSNLSTQKDQIQNTITALEALLLTPRTKEEFLKFFNTHKNALTHLKDHLLSFSEEPQPSIHETLENLHQEYTTSQDQENSCILTLDAAQRIRDVCLRGDVERINAFIPALKKRTEYRSLAAEKEAQGKTEEAWWWNNAGEKCNGKTLEVWDWNNAADACLGEAGELAKDTPNGALVAAYGQAAQNYAQAAKAWAKGNREEAQYWNNTALMYGKQADELAKDTPNDAVAAAYGKGAQYYAQAAKAQAQGKTVAAWYWNDAADACLCEAKELAKNPPNDAAVAAYGQGAQYYAHAAEAWDQGKIQEARYWNNAGRACHNQANELAKNTPNNAAAAVYKRAAQYYAQAAEAWAQGKTQEARYLNTVGWMCNNQAKELAKNPPNDAAAAAYGQGAEYYAQAAKAWAQGKTQVAIDWNNAGFMCNNQAKELAKDTPNEAAAAAYGQGAAECYKKAAEAQALEKPQDARYWEQAAIMFNKKADELAEAEPNAHSPLNEYARYYTEKVDNLITQLEENKKINQSIRGLRSSGI